MSSEDKLMAIVVSAIFMTLTACVYIMASVFPRADADAKARILQELNKTLPILVSLEFSPEKKRNARMYCARRLASKAGRGNEHE